MEALKSTSGIELEHVVTVISTVQNANMEFVTALQQLISATNAGVKHDALILSFGAMAAHAQPDVELAIATFLMQQMNSTNRNDTSTIIHLLLAMANTGSNHVVNSIIETVNHRSKEVQKIAIKSLTKFTYLEQVQSHLQEFLSSGTDDEMLSTITKTLINGLHYAEEIDVDMSKEANYPLLSSLVNAVMHTNDIELMNRVSWYVKIVGGELALSQLHQLHPRLRRETDWDEHNPHYDCIGSQSSRASDVATYPKHKAYAFGKTLGTGDINMTVSAGTFAGISNNCTNMKVLSKACARLNVFSWYGDIAEFELSAQNDGNSTVTTRAYAQILGFTLLMDERVFNDVYRADYTNFDFQHQQKILNIPFTYPVYAFKVQIVLSVYLGLTMKFDAQMTALLDTDEYMSAQSAIVPQFNVTVEGSGSVSDPLVSYKWISYNYC